MDYFYSPPEASLARLLVMLSSDEAVLDRSEKERLQLWNRLVEFIFHHRCVVDEASSFKNELILSIERIAEKLTPSDPLNLYQRLFCGDKFDLYEEMKNPDTQREKVAKNTLFKRN